MATLAMSFDRWIDVVEQVLAGFSVSERATAADGTARLVYRLPP